MAEVIKNSLGYYSLKNLPSERELSDYYAQKYYQTARGNYESIYTADEITYFNNKIAEKFFLINQHLETGMDKSLLDIGCGEGWTLGFFKKQGWVVKGIDYSDYGCQKFNPDISENLLLGDIYKNISVLVGSRKRFSVVWMKHVLEHVLDPLDLLERSRLLLKPGGMLVVEVPNDFSKIQEYLIKTGKVDRQFWVVSPDHISYFSRESLDVIASKAGFKNLITIGDYPIDFNLLNPDTNYVMDSSKGKKCHKMRIEMENFMHTLSLEKTVAYYKALADLGLGREIISFYTQN